MRVSLLLSFVSGNPDSLAALVSPGNRLLGCSANKRYIPVRFHLKMHADLPTAKCTSYRDHSILTLTLSIATTLSILVLPLPSIPTPRRFLLGVLLLLGLFVLVSGILARYYVLARPASSVYLIWYVAESTLTILFANLPFLSSLVSSTTPNRVRHFSSGLSLSRWPRSYKNTPPLRAQRERLDSTAASISTLSPVRSQQLCSVASTVSPPDVEDVWGDTSAPPSIPPTPIHKLSPSDPPPELEVYWTMRRPSALNADLEKMGKETQWPLR